MFFNGKIYKVKKFTKGVHALFDLICEEQMKEQYNPLKEFVKTLDGLNQVERTAAITTFISTGQHKVYPEFIVLMAQNSLNMCKFLANELLDLDIEITEENKADILHGIYLHINDPEKEGIEEIKGMRKNEQ